MTEIRNPGLRVVIVLSLSFLVNYSHIQLSYRRETTQGYIVSKVYSYFSLCISGILGAPATPFLGPVFILFTLGPQFKQETLRLRRGR